MKNKFYVYMSNGGRILTQVFVLIFVAVLAIVPLVLGDADLTSLIVIFVAIGVVLIGSLLSLFATRTGDYILLTEEGISYRHLGREKLFIPYAEAAVFTKRIKGMRGNRYGDAIVIGQRGSIPADPPFSLRGFSSLTDGWFTCVFNPRLLSELAARNVADERENCDDEQGVAGSQRPARKESHTAARRKADDTHDDFDDHGGEGGWRID